MVKFNEKGGIYLFDELNYLINQLEDKETKALLMQIFFTDASSRRGKWLFRGAILFRY